MMEKRWPEVPPQAFTADGTDNGLVTLADTTMFKVKEKVYIAGSALPTIHLEVKDVISLTMLVVGPQRGSILMTTDVSAYTVAAGSNIYTTEPQQRPAINSDEYMRAVYDEEPTVALRSVLVDELGDRISSNNPLPVAIDGTITIGDVSIVEGGNTMGVNPDGSINVDITKGIGLFTLPYDSIEATYPSTTVENYQSYVGGLSGTPVQLVVVTYTDITKNFIFTVVRTPTGP